MPFIEQTPKEFTYAGITSIERNQRGVYGIFGNNKWIYVGKAEDIRERLLQHLNDKTSDIHIHKPTHWVANVYKDDPTQAEKDLIREFNPACNQRIG